MANRFSKYKLRKWSVKVRWRDRVCQVCGTRKRLEAHHLNDKSYHPKQAYHLKNGITLCKPCHVFFHTKVMGSFRKKCTTKDFSKFELIIDWIRNADDC